MLVDALLLLLMRAAGRRRAGGGLAGGRRARARSAQQRAASSSITGCVRNFEYTDRTVSNYSWKSVEVALNWTVGDVIDEISRTNELPSRQLALYVDAKLFHVRARANMPECPGLMQRQWPYEWEALSRRVALIPVKPGFWGTEASYGEGGDDSDESDDFVGGAGTRARAGFHFLAQTGM